jgi:hypothetical protein
MPVREALKLIDEVLNCYAVIFFAQMTLTAIELKSCTVDSCKDDDAVNVRLLKTVLSKHVTQTVFPVRDLLHSNFKNALDILNLHNKTFTHNGKAYIVDHHHTTATQTPIDSRDTTNSHADDQHSHSDMDRMLPTRLGAPAPSTHATFSANFNAVAAAPAADEEAAALTEDGHLVAQVRLQRQGLLPALQRDLPGPHHPGPLELLQVLPRVAVLGLRQDSGALPVAA